MDINRLTNNLASKMNKEIGHRPDIMLADAKPVNNATAHIMLEYADNAPTAQDVGEFFLKKFDNKITPFLSTAKVYPQQKVVTVVAQLLNITRDMDYVNSPRMKPVIAGAMYYDVPLQDLWEVQQRGDQKVLVRKVKDDIMSIVNARKNGMLPTNKTFASVMVTAGNVSRSSIENGDNLKFFDAADGSVKEGVVIGMSQHDDLVKVKYSGGVLPIGLEAVLEVKKPGQKKYKDLRDYYTDAYGDPKYAKDLTKYQNPKV